SSVKLTRSERSASSSRNANSSSSVVQPSPPRSSKPVVGSSSAFSEEVPSCWDADIFKGLKTSKREKITVDTIFCLIFLSFFMNIPPLLADKYIFVTLDLKSTRLNSSH